MLIFTTSYIPFHLCSQAREHHEYFKRFPHGWAIEEFIKTSLKNKRAYAHKQGYFQKPGNANGAASNRSEDSLDGDDMYVDEPGNGELEGNMGESGAENGDFEGDNEDEWKQQPTLISPSN